jgi:hypothetical protein
MRERERRQGRSSDFGAARRMRQLAYCAYAIEYLDAALAVRTMRTRFRLAQTYLTCHAIELALRAYLSLHADSANHQFRRNLRTRDLWSLLEESELHGLGRVVRLTLAQRGEIKKATRYYSQAVLEYPALAEIIRGYSLAPDIGPLMSAARSLVRAARGATGVRVARRRKRT